MDDLTAKRVEGDIKQVGAALTHTATKLGDAAAQATALQAEFAKYIPPWAADLSTMPSAMMTYCFSRLRRHGAPKGYATELLKMALHDDLPRLFPVDKQIPAWLVDPEACGDCGEPHPDGMFRPGGPADQLSLVTRLLLFAYTELYELVANLDDENEAPLGPDEDDARLEAKTFELVALFEGLSDALMALEM